MTMTDAVKHTTDTRPSGLPSERAMKAAVSMEIHSACSTSTLGKGRALDESFPAYDDLLEALEACAEDDGFLGLTFETRERISAAIAKAEGRA